MSQVKRRSQDDESGNGSPARGKKSAYDCIMYEDINKMSYNDLIILKKHLDQESSIDIDIDENINKLECIKKRIDLMTEYNKLGIIDIYEFSEILSTKTKDEIDEFLKMAVDNEDNMMKRKITNFRKYGPQKREPVSVPMEKDIIQEKYVNEPVNTINKQMDFINDDNIKTHQIVSQLTEKFESIFTECYKRNYESDFFLQIDVNYFVEIHIFKEKYCYSSYHYPINISQKHHIWFTQNLSQAILHLFDRPRGGLDVIKPIIYRFTINDNINRIISFKKYTVRFQDISFLFPIECVESIKESLIDYFEAQSDPDSMFNEEKNKRLLYIFEALNNFLSEKNKIYGYKNYNDQDEFGMINTELFKADPLESFYKNITFTKIDETKQKITQTVEFNDNDKILSADYFNKNLIFNVYKTSISNNKKGMSCNGKLVDIQDDFREYNVMIDTIILQNFDNFEETIVFNCAEENRYMQKYLKYKQKYLKLKYAV